MYIKKKRKRSHLCVCVCIYIYYDTDDGLLLEPCHCEDALYAPAFFTFNGDAADDGVLPPFAVCSAGSFF